MRHIPEEELHSYLDQALSRSQCIEIEIHLSACNRCRQSRDEIADIRDRTTALLSLVAPRYCSLASYTRLAALADTRATVPRQHPVITSKSVGWRNRLLASSSFQQAAMIMLAVGAGWGARSWLTATAPPLPDTDLLATLPSSESANIGGSGFRMVADAATLTFRSSANHSTGQPTVKGEERPRIKAPGSVTPKLSQTTASTTQLAVANTSSEDLSLTVRTESAALPASDFSSGGLWRTISWSEAEALSGDAVPRIAGYPVLDVQVQKLSQDERPLLLVSQQDPASGNIVRTIEGPVQLVAELLAAEIARSNGAIRSSSPGRSQPDYLFSESGAPKRSIRVVTVAGRLPADSLDFLARGLTLR